PISIFPLNGDLCITHSVIPQELPHRHSCGSRNLKTLSARLRCLGRGALDSRPRIGVRGKLHGNDGEDSLF
ncbi:hypothetical protein GBAR_LOCUS29799, partial [Geodia barretti]